MLAQIPCGVQVVERRRTEARGIEPYDIEDADNTAKLLCAKALCADIKIPLPYRAKSFSLVIFSDALVYLSPKYLNKTLPDFLRISAGGLVIYAAGYPGLPKSKTTEASKFYRPA
ncbi:hypothetical protein QQ045_030214 [Rhodiola kirilowii]